MYGALLLSAWSLGCGGAPCPACPACGAPLDADGAARSTSPTPSTTVESAPLPDMVRVPAGAFLRGSPDGVGLRDERPQRSIELDAFDIDRVEVSRGAYDACVAAGACRAPACTEQGDEPETRPDFPVNCVTWEAAKRFCAWADKRLPTEAEWEKAARGEQGARWPWGEGDPSCERANYFDCGNAPRAVGSLPAGKSPYGALDMAGNMFEWVADWHHPDYYAISPAENPEGPWSGEKKVVRGGAFSYGADEMTTTSRTFDRPVKAYDQVGFRCARSVDGGT